MRTTRGILAIGALILLAGCGIQIETGPEDQQRLSEVSETRAKEIRSEYALQIQNADAVGKAQILKMMVDSVSANYIRYGFRVANDWRTASEGRGTDVPDTEMREIVSRSNQSQRAIFGAYEDVIDMAIDEIKLDAEFDATTMGWIDEFTNHFYKVYSGVFYPSGSPDRYDQELSDLKYETERLSRELERDLQRY